MLWNKMSKCSTNKLRKMKVNKDWLYNFIILFNIYYIFFSYTNIYIKNN
jgi:hypothetical protein